MTTSAAMPEDEREEVRVALVRLEEKLTAATSRIGRIEAIITIVGVAIVGALVAAVAEVI